MHALGQGMLERKAGASPIKPLPGQGWGVRPCTAPQDPSRHLGPDLHPQSLPPCPRRTSCISSAEPTLGEDRWGPGGAPRSALGVELTWHPRPLQLWTSWAGCWCWIQ